MRFGTQRCEWIEIGRAAGGKVGKALLFLSVLLYAPIVWAEVISGASSGSFESPTGPVHMVVTGVGTSYFTWGNQDGFGTGPSSLRFTGATFNKVPPETEFEIGTLDYSTAPLWWVRQLRP
jgi:hypothetical protein